MSPVNYTDYPVQSPPQIENKPVPPKSGVISPYIAKRLALVVGGIGIIAVATFPSLYFYSRYQAAQNKASQPSVLGAKEIDELVKKVGTLIVIPDTEAPTIATVTDKNALNSQDFFKRAENGDKVLIFAKARKAYLYRPSENKIIEVGPVNIPTGSPTSAAVPTPLLTQPQTQAASSSGTITPTQTEKVNVVILNGSTNRELGKEVSDRLTQNIQGINILKRDSARKTDYKKTQVIDITSKSRAKVEEIAKYLNGEVQIDLPDGEVKPNGDILVIAAE